MFEKTKALCDSFLEMDVPGFDFLVYKNGKEYFRYMGGYADREAGIPIKGTERYYIYSCTKPITVTAAMQLWEQGKFSLDDRLSDYLPVFKEMRVKTETGTQKAENPILIRHLFTMTAGFHYDYQSPNILAQRAVNPNPTTRQAMEWLALDPLLFEPGDRYRYSLAHDVLGALIEVWSGQSFESYVKAHIFDPLGMADSTMKLPDSEKNTMAALYRFDKTKMQSVREPDVMDRFGKHYVSGGGGCITTMNDYVKFAEGLRTGERLLKRETLKLMTTNQLSLHQRRTYSLKAVGYGLGMWTPMEGQLRRDYGWGGAAGALLGVDESRGLSIVYAQHLLNAPNQGLRGQMVRTFLSELEGLDYFVPDPAEPQKYNLTY